MLEKIRSLKGLTLVELAIFVIIIGVVAAFTVPRFRDAVERAKAAEAFNYLSAVRASQERYYSRQGTYTDDTAKLNIKLNAPGFFSVGEIAEGVTGSLEDSWTQKLTRIGPSPVYGEYTVTFTEEGFDAVNSTIAETPAINPMKT
ncbi:type IV pilin protein [Elusimicrobiota bacterium]